MKFTPATYEGEHLVLLPAGLTGTVDLADGTTVDLGPAAQTVIGVETHEQAMEVALEASRLAAADPDIPLVQVNDEQQSIANFTAEGYAPDSTDDTDDTVGSKEF